MDCLLGLRVNLLQKQYYRFKLKTKTQKFIEHGIEMDFTTPIALLVFCWFLIVEYVLLKLEETQDH